ncbi:HAD-IA family hydrolase [Actinomycetospora cinnamomea]|uniref:HAD superfamily hydrolase (TIGR01509 family) n=1 Tax=Actinomycetospora cinnamomea TaxID=663609 RepID=A0A2U1FLV8_9PSEU|nr:HAD-IA family hydrolase [Actinomycetospora cinnamomea]PVZ13149.1 HAD superfamily hydrolase (TIGR01509 family) [Actinomycetospora cinnamomea]
MSSPGPLAAVVFDVDGTLADTERDGHRVAFNDAFAAHGVDLHWDVERYGELLEITGGRPRIEADLRAHGLDDPAALAAAVHRTKTELFADVARRGAIAPRPGVRELVEDLRTHGVRIAVATTGQRAWVEPLIAHLLGAGTAEVVVCGDDVAELKPDPEAYLLALDRLCLEAGEVVAVEDSGPGLRAACAAGLATVVVTNGYTAGHDLSGAALVRDAFDEPDQLTAAGLAVMAL